MPSFSLIGALEFRRVVTSLKQEAAGTSLSLFDSHSPVTPLPGGHVRYHSFSSSGHARSRSHTPLGHNRDREHDPWDAALGVPLHDRSPPEHTPHRLSEDETTLEVTHPIAITITHTPASPRSEADESEAEGLYVPLTRTQRVLRVLGHVFRILFPTLHEFRAKSIVGKVVSVLAAPAVMILTLTLPVVVTDFTGAELREEKRVVDEDDERSVIRSERLIDFEEEGVERTLVAEQEVEEEMHELKFNKWLMAAQCVLGPLWCVAVLFGEWVLCCVTKRTEGLYLLPQMERPMNRGYCSPRVCLGWQ